MEAVPPSTSRPPQLLLAEAYDSASDSDSQDPVAHSKSDDGADLAGPEVGANHGCEIDRATTNTTASPSASPNSGSSASSITTDDTHGLRITTRDAEIVRGIKLAQKSQAKPQQRQYRKPGIKMTNPLTNTLAMQSQRLADLGSSGLTAHLLAHDAFRNPGALGRVVALERINTHGTNFTSNAFNPEAYMRIASIPYAEKMRRAAARGNAAGGSAGGALGAGNAFAPASSSAARQTHAAGRPRRLEI